MNREIKFRAWDPHFGKGIYDPHPIIDFGLMQTNGQILMQFTGLKDKNGKDIYEGDIVSGWRVGSNSDRSYTGEIKWNQQQCGFYILDGKYFLQIISLGMSGGEDGTRLNTFQIIGNIYENPSLLKPLEP